MAACGDNLSYQWFFNGGQVGDDSPTLTINPATESGSVYVIITDANNCSVQSNTVNLTLKPDPAIFLSGDSDIGNPNFINSGDNKTLFSNILQGGTVVKIYSGTNNPSSSPNLVEINNYYNSLPGVESNLYQPNPPLITSSDLEGVDLFISALPSQAYTESEISALTSYLNGCGKVFFIGEIQDGAATENGYINEALMALGSSLQLGEDSIDPAPPAQITDQIEPDPFTQGVTSIAYADTNSVSGGTVLVRTKSDGQMPNTPFIAYELV